MNTKGANESDMRSWLLTGVLLTILFSANLNAAIDNEAIDPISGSVPHRAYLCEIRRIAT